MKKTAILMMLITIISKLIGFVREITLSYFYGASNVSDAYLISLTVPGIIFSYIGAGLHTGYIPMYSNIEKAQGASEGNKYTNNLINILVIISTAIIIFGLVYTEPIVKLFANGFKGDTLRLAVNFTKISFLGIYFIGLTSIFGGFLQIKGNYVIPAFIGFPMNFFIILFIFISSKTNIVALSIGSLLATASQTLLMLPFIKKNGYKYKFFIDFKDRNIRNMIYMAIPVIIGISVNQINIIVDRTIASNLAEGGISALNYASKLNGFVQGLFVATITTSLYPIISKMAADYNIDEMKRVVREAINIVNLLVLPSAVGLMLFAEPIVRLLFGRGAFDSQAISLTSDGLFYYSIGMVGFGLHDLLSRAFYSLKDTKTPVIYGSLSVVINIVLNIILSRYLGIGGLALATSISALFSTALLFLKLKKKIGHFGIKSMSISFIKILFASLIMGFVSKLSYRLLLYKINLNLSLIIAIGVGVLAYFTIILFMRIDEVDSTLNKIKEFIKRYFKERRS